MNINYFVDLRKKTESLPDVSEKLPLAAARAHALESRAAMLSTEFAELCGDRDELLQELRELYPRQALHQAGL